MKVIFHFDADAFFVSCAQIKNPDTIGKPTIVASADKGGFISAVSYEAREFGIKTTMLTKQALKLFPKLNVLEIDYDWYKNVSERMFNVLEFKYQIKIEKLSVDEGWIDVSKNWGAFGSAVEFAKHMQKTVEKEIGITISIGISFTKWLAKMATGLRKPKGITSIGPNEIKGKLFNMSIKQFWGIGKTKFEKLSQMDIETIGDLWDKRNDERLLPLFKNSLNNYMSCLEGVSSDKINPYRERNKEISAAKTFYGNLTSYNELKECIKDLSNKIACRAIDAGKIGLLIGVSYKNTASKIKIKQKKIRIPIQTSREVFNEAIKLFDNIWKREPVRLISVKIGNTKKINVWTFQQSFFDKETRIMEKLPI